MILGRSFHSVVISKFSKKKEGRQLNSGNKIIIKGIHIPPFLLWGVLSLIYLDLGQKKEKKKFSFRGRAGKRRKIQSWFVFVLDFYNSMGISFYGNT